MIGSRVILLHKLCDISNALRYKKGDFLIKSTDGRHKMLNGNCDDVGCGARKRASKEILLHVRRVSSPTKGEFTFEISQLTVNLIVS